MKNNLESKHPTSDSTQEGSIKNATESNPTQKIKIRKYQDGVSIVLATYNGERFLREQLESLRNQTFAPIEIIISDDNSSDSTNTIIDRFIKTTNIPTTWIRNVPGLGYADNFLQAAHRAKGSYVAFCDQDDIWSTRKLEVCSDYFGRPDISIITHTAELINASGEHIGYFNQGIRKTNTRPPWSHDVWGTFWGFSIVFRRQILDVAGFQNRFVDYITPNMPIAHDRWITFLGQTLGKTVEISEPLVKYRQHENNLYGKSYLKNQLQKTRTQIAAESKTYIQATRRMLEIIDEIDPAAELLFPEFNRIKSKKVLEKALVILSQRDAIYRSPRIIDSLIQVFKNSTTGIYTNPHNQKIRIRSLLKDLAFIIKK